MPIDRVSTVLYILVNLSYSSLSILYELMFSCKVLDFEGIDIFPRITKFLYDDISFKKSSISSIFIPPLESSSSMFT